MTAILTEGESAMKAIMKSEAAETITTHYIDGVWVESHGRDVIKTTPVSISANPVGRSILD